jgi:exonuclease SbcD
MPRLLHMADVHLGARHHDLGPAATELRRRQFAAFEAAISLAIDEHVDALLICGDLFDSNNQPRRSVEAAAAELGRLAERDIPVVIIPGTHDCYDEGSIYRVFDLPTLAGTSADRLVVLTPDRSSVDLPQLATTIHARIFPARRAPRSPLAGFATGVAAANGDEPARWHVGMIHGTLAQGAIDDDEVVFSAGEVAASGLDYLALGHWHSTRQGRAGATTWAYSGAPEPLAFDQAEGAGNVLLVKLAEDRGQKEVSVEARKVGRTRFARLELDVAEAGSGALIARRLKEAADPDLVLDVRLVGVRPDDLDLAADEIEQQLAPDFLRLRLRDSSVAASPDGPPPPADTIAGAFVLDLEARIAAAEEAVDPGDAAELREALRVGRLLLDDAERVVLA